MSDENLLTRREFTLESALAILSAATITITGCGDDDDPGTAPSGQGSEVGTIRAAQIVAIGQNQQVSVTSTTNEAHNHTVTFN